MKALLNQVENPLDSEDCPGSDEEINFETLSEHETESEAETTCRGSSDEVD